MLVKIASQLAHSEYERCLPRTAVMAVFTFLGHVRCFLTNGELKLGTKSNQNGTERVNSIFENPTKINVSCDFHRVSDIPNWEYWVRLCTHVSEKN